MKRIFSTLLVFTLCFLSSINVLADENIIIKQERLEVNNNSFTAVISINPKTTYAGSEFSVVCSEGTSIEKVEFSEEGSKAGPKKVDNTTYFSIFSGDNDFNGKITLTLQGTYKENVQLNFSNIKIYKKDGVKVITEETSENQIIKLNKETFEETLTPDIDNNEDNSTSQNESNKSENNISQNTNGSISNTSDKITIFASICIVLLISALLIYKYKKSNINTK